MRRLVMFSICALLYGDHCELATRCLTSIETAVRDGGPVRDLRIGCNALGEASRRFVWDFAARQPVPVRLYEPCDGHNAGKYTLMRRMLHDDASPIAPRMMWFDDDSWLDGVTGRWWSDLVSSDAVVLGRVHFMLQRGDQHLGIARQPWFRGREVAPGHRYRFATGGWWVADTAFLRRFDYPFPILHHNGGDSILGELLRQQDRAVADFSRACCHCDSCRSKPAVLRDAGVVHVNDQGGLKGRRGLGRKGEVYPWQRFDPQHPADYSQHAYRSYVHSFGAVR